MPLSREPPRLSIVHIVTLEKDTYKDDLQILIFKYSKTTGKVINLFNLTSLGLVINLGQPLFPQERIDLISGPQMMVDLSIIGLTHCCELD